MVAYDIENNFKGKKVFITGHTGFKGTWLTILLERFGSIVRGYSLDPPSTPSLFESVKSNLSIDSIIGDINDFDFLNQKIVEFKPDYIFHLAAQPLVRKSYNETRETFSTNIIGTANLLESLKNLQKECVSVLITTDKVYENLEISYAYKELDRLGGYDPYSSSKACAELIINSYRQSFFNVEKWNSHSKSIASARAGNVIGGGDWAEDRLLPDIIRAVYSKKKVVVRNPNSIRPWQHVLDPLMGYLTLACKMKSNPTKYSSSWNFGPTEDGLMSVIELAEFTLMNLGFGEIEIINNVKLPHEAKLLQLDINKALQQLDWRPKISSKNAVEMSVKWYEGYYLQNYRAYDLCINDIQTYLNLDNE